MAGRGHPPRHSAAFFSVLHGDRAADRARQVLPEPSPVRPRCHRSSKEENWHGMVNLNGNSPILEILLLLSQSLVVGGEILIRWGILIFVTQSRQSLTIFLGFLIQGIVLGCS